MILLLEGSGMLKMIDIHLNSVCKEFNIGTDQKKIIYHQAQQLLVAWSSSNRMTLWDVETGVLLRVINIPKATDLFFFNSYLSGTSTKKEMNIRIVAQSKNGIITELLVDKLLKTMISYRAIFSITNFKSNWNEKKGVKQLSIFEDDIFLLLGDGTFLRISFALGELIGKTKISHGNCFHLSREVNPIEMGEGIIGNNLFVVFGCSNGLVQIYKAREGKQGGSFYICGATKITRHAKRIDHVGFLKNTKMFFFIQNIPATGKEVDKSKVFVFSQAPGTQVETEEIP